MTQLVSPAAPETPDQGESRNENNQLEAHGQDILRDKPPPLVITTRDGHEDVQIGFVVCATEGPECHHADRRRRVASQPVEQHMARVRRHAGERQAAWRDAPPTAARSKGRQPDDRRRADAVRRPAVRAERASRRPAAPPSAPNSAASHQEGGWHLPGKGASHLWRASLVRRPPASRPPHPRSHVRLGTASAVSSPASACARLRRTGWQKLPTRRACRTVQKLRRAGLGGESPIALVRCLQSTR